MTRYTIYHNDGPRRFSERAFAEWPEFGYRWVGSVMAENPGHAFELANTIHGPWWENPGTELAPGLTGARSLSVGDVLIDDDGKALGVAGIGFKELT